MTSKYDSLPILLKQHGGSRVRLTFAEIEQFLGFELPASKRYAAWWSNNPTNSVMTKVWLDAGWRTQDVDLAGEQLTFVRDPYAGVRSSAMAGGGDQYGESETEDSIVDLSQLNKVAFNVLAILARRSGKTIADEAVDILNDQLSR